MSHHSGFNVKWSKRCFVCQKPLDPLIQFYNIKQLERYILFHTLRPVNLCYNFSMLKYLYGKMRRVCSWCFEHPPNISCRDIAVREMTGRSILKESRSLSDREIYVWHEAFYNFLNRDDHSLIS